MPQLLPSWPVTAALGTVVVTYIIRFFVRGYHIRKTHRSLPSPPHSWILGSLGVMAEVAMTLPRRVHPHVLPTLLRKKYKLGSFFYLDLWPIDQPLLAIADPDVCQQFSVEYQPQKHYKMKSLLVHLAGKDDMVSSNGAQWKKWRTMFNPGFSTQHLMTLVPGIVEDVLIYCEILKEHAKAEDIFRLEEASTRLTIDVIGKIALDVHFNMQRGDNECITAFREQVHLLPNEDQTVNPFQMWYPSGIYKRWKNDRIMKRYIGKILDERFATKDLSIVQKHRKRTVLDLALDSYLRGETEVKSDGKDKPHAMDRDWKEGAITQIRILLFAGHDTTSSTICYVFYLLRKNPECARKIRKEHEAVFGPLSDTAEAIKKDPHLLNKLEYTLAVIKETLRLFPPASSPRNGEKDLYLVDRKTGERYPTEGYMIWLVHHCLGHNEEVWGPTASIFDPERFMPPNASKIPEGAFRSFETGPRNCLGQNLAIYETKVILALTCRQFEFDVALDEESLKQVGTDGSFYAKDESFRKGKQDVLGEELYQILVGAAKPREGMPTRVRLIDVASFRLDPEATDERSPYNTRDIRSEATFSTEARTSKNNNDNNNPPAQAHGHLLHCLLRLFHAASNPIDHADGHVIKHYIYLPRNVRFDFSEPFTVLVGEDEVRFTVHKDILCYQSGFFRAACSRDWIENQEKVIKMPEADADTFRSFLQFAYRGEVVVLDPGERDSDTNGNEELLRLARLANLSNFLQNLVLKNTIMDLIRSIFKARDNKPPSADFFSFIYEHEQSGSSKLRGFLLDWFCTKATGNWLAENREEVPERFLGDVAVRWAKANGDRTRLLDTEVFSLCYYHERESMFHPCPCGRKGATKVDT